MCVCMYGGETAVMLSSTSSCVYRSGVFHFYFDLCAGVCVDSRGKAGGRGASC